MKHTHIHEHDIEFVNISTDFETIIDKVTESIVIIITAHTIAHIFKKTLIRA